MINNPKLQNQVRKQTPRKTLQTQPPSQNASSSPNGKSKRHKTKWIQKTTPQPNRETKEAVNDDIVINTQLHYNESQRWIMPNFQKSATRVSLSSLWKTWKPTKPPTFL